jgi:peptide deformylase
MSFSVSNRQPRAPRRILHLGEPELRQKAVPVDPSEIASEEIQDVIDDLIFTMRDANGAGLAATQIGEEVRICVIEVDHNPRYPYKPQIPLTVLVNPVLTALSSACFVNNEGCLSVPGLRGDVARLTEIRVTALDRDGARLDFTVCGLSAGTYQHECDHLDGMLFVDKLVDSASLTTWENFERYRRDEYLIRVAELVGRYEQ